MTEPADIYPVLRRAGLIAAGEMPRATALTGGVSSEVLRVDLASGPVCIKRALPQLKVAALWEAPVERALSEVAWIETVAVLDPAIVPKIRYVEPEAFLFVMDFLDPADHPCWKPLLAAGKVDAQFAGRVGDALGRIHGYAARTLGLASRFANSEFFHALRIDPYILHTARAHPDRADVLNEVAEGLSSARIGLVHGDISPKNILKGPEGPVFLDAETATWGDPVFDLAFCLNHLLLKAVWHPESAPLYADSFAAFRNAYLPHVTWEDAGAYEARAARLLSALLLARIDGKSPVEYLTEARQKDFVRAAARDFLAETRLDLTRLPARWYERIGAL